FALGGLIALFERIVGYYAVHLGLNPYDQPQVEEGKKSAASIIEIKKKLSALLSTSRFASWDADELKGEFDPEEYGILYYLLLQMKAKGLINAEDSELDKLLG
ncbi:MAG: hypothetical protein FWF83_07245, partial [Clostridiales bacterium]|nr:hypothetical protein [Clostridiales bacterium]